MVISCAAINCTQRYQKGTGITFHRFPLDNKDLLLKWLLALRRKNFIPSKHSKICSKHFQKEDYIDEPGSFMPRLKEGAVPSIFDFSGHSKTMEKKRKTPNKQNTPANSMEEAVNSMATDDESRAKHAHQVVPSVDVPANQQYPIVIQLKAGPAPRYFRKLASKRKPPKERCADMPRKNQGINGLSY